ncbi:MAG: nitrilase-related carbon-nitrogen hydrolase [Chthonomonadales bacterium]
MLKQIFRSPILHAIIAGSVMAAAFPPYHNPIALPIGVALLIKTILRCKPKHAFYLGTLTGLVFFGATLFWLSNLFGAASISLIAICALFPGIFGALLSFVTRTFPRIPAVVIVPILWVGVDYYRSEQFYLAFGWNQLALAGMGAPIIGNVAAIVGGYGITFLIVLYAAGIIQLKSIAGRTSLIAIGMIGWIIILSFPSDLPQPNNPIAVRLVQNPNDPNEMVTLSHKPGDEPVDVVIWPEYSFLEDPKSRPKDWDLPVSVAKSANTFVLFGAKRTVGETFQNTAYLLDPSGNEVGFAEKNHPVHFIKDGIASKRKSPITTTLGKLGVAICFDFDFPEVARSLVQQGAEVLLVPSMDPGEWGPVQREQHRLMFQLRAAENGRWIARADVAGGTSFVAPDGQQMIAVNTTDATTLTGTIGRERFRTLYSLGGWMIGLACFSASILLILATITTGLIHRRNASTKFDSV